MTMRYDIITAFMIRFYFKDCGYWKVEDWEKFITVVRSLLAPRGYCHLEFNKETELFPETHFVDGDVTAFFKRVGKFENGIFRFS